LAELQTPQGLFPSNDVRAATDDWLTRELCRTREQLRAGPVSANLPVDAFDAELAELDFAGPQDIKGVLGWVLSRMGPGMVHVTHPRYFGLFNPTPTYAAECADRIVGCLNPQLASARTSPFPVALEAALIAKLAQRTGLPSNAGGHFTTSGSEANYTAALCALTNANPLFATEGARAFAGRPTIYISADAHLAWLKIAHQAGIGRNAIRLVATDGQGRLDTRALVACIEADLSSGCAPAMIVATAGTTAAGMIDPLGECGDIATRYGAWFHVDAAWGGALMCSDQTIGLIEGIASADSITMDAHKWFATTMCCGIFLTSKPHVLSDTFHATMDCMPSNLAGIDPWITTVQWSRRFLGLRLFVALACVGWEGYAAHVEKAISLAAMLKSFLEGKGWTQLNESSLAILCLRPPPGAADPRQIAKSIVQEGEAWISTAEFEGEWVIRACITSGETTEADVVRLAVLLQKHAFG
jgi:glutamate/tyrosine decarboxylase-like PLP-dependent enzyme